MDLQHTLVQGSSFLTPPPPLSDPSCNSTTLQCFGQSFAFLCSDKNGWAILSRDGTMNSCFIDGAILLFPSALIVLFGPIDLLARSRKTQPQPSPWYQILKLVSFSFFFHFVFHFVFFHFLFFHLFFSFD